MDHMRDKRRWRWLPTLILLVLLGILLAYWGIFSGPPPSAHRVQNSPSTTVVQPTPALTISHPQQKRYRIDPTQSTATYQVQELLLGNIQGRLVTGVSAAISGDLLLDFADPQASQVGAIAVNVEALTSDSRLRDSRIRAAYLESTRYPTVTFVPTQLLNFPVEPSMNEAFTFTLAGALTVKETTIATTWVVTTTLTPDRLVGQATTTIAMSSVGVGPIQIAGLLETEDALQLQLAFVALPVEESLPAVVAPVALTATAILTPPQRVAGAPEFFADVEPILARRCTGCHLPGQIGHSVYPMETVRDVVTYADDLALVVEHGYMPPWPPGALTPSIQHARALAEDEKATLLAWVAAGTPVNGPLTTLLDAIVDPTIPQLRPDLTLQMPEPYRPTGENEDEYRCFLIDPQIDGERFFTGYQLTPGEVSIVHHMILFVVDERARTEAEQRAYADGRPGWQCFGDTGLTNTTSSVAISWTPGEGAVLFPAGTGVHVGENSLFVLQVHYFLAAGLATDQSHAVLQLSEPGEQLIGLQAIDLFAPVEIPCPAGDTSERCQRSYGIRRVQQYDPNADTFADGLLVVCNRSLADYRNQPHDNVQTDCDQEVSLDGEIVSIYAHMHEMGRQFRIELNPDTPDAKILLDIPHWDFDWQSTYTYETREPVKKGDTLRITCRYENRPTMDRSTAPRQPASAWREPFVKAAQAHDEIATGAYRYVVWGEGTRDEMCLGSLIVWPANPDLPYAPAGRFAMSEWQIMMGILWLRAQPYLPWVALGLFFGGGTLALLYYWRRGGS
ncbi:MAG: YceI family protein [Caldilineaceae bacterium]